MSARFKTYMWAWIAVTAAAVPQVTAAVPQTNAPSQQLPPLEIAPNTPQPKLAAKQALKSSAQDSDSAAKDAPDPPGSRPPAVAPAGQLPWSNRDVRGARPPASPREMFRDLRIDDSALRALFDGEPLGNDDEETVLLFLLNIRRMGRVNVHRWQQDVPLEQLAADPAKHRANVFSLSGKVVNIEPRELVSERTRLEFKRFFVLTIKPFDSPHPVIVCARDLPGQWLGKDGQPLSGPFDAQLQGFFLKTGEGDPVQLVFAADHVRWRPRQLEPARGVRAGQLLLSQHEMDLGLLDVAKQHNGKPLGGNDRLAFYQMLSAASNVTEEELAGVNVPKVDLAALLVRPKTIHGDLMKMRVRAARVTRVQVQDEDVRSLYGIDHYFQLDGFLPLGEQSVRLGNDEESPEYKNNFPVTLCLIELPPALKDVDKRIAESDSPTEMLDAELDLNAFFFKIWAYKAKFIDDRTPGKFQPAPMLFPVSVRIVEAGGVNSDTLSLIFGVGFVAMLGLVCVGLWWTSRGDLAAAQKLHQRQEPDEVDFGGLDD